MESVPQPLIPMKLEMHLADKTLAPRTPSQLVDTDQLLEDPPLVFNPLVPNNQFQYVLTLLHGPDIEVVS